ncbi:MAG: helicase [Pirellulaceae bacterium]
MLVVVAEILLNRLMHPEAFDFSDVASVVMDEFHSFNEPERGVVWELSLALLPRHVRTMLLSATVGNAYEFCSWLRTQHDRSIELVSSDDRKVPLEFHWIGDTLLGDHIEWMYEGRGEARRTPALVFCFNREECWSVAQELRGRKLVDAETQKRLAERLDLADLSRGAGPTLKQLLMRGVGVHHAGVLPCYRRLVETLFQEKLLSVVVCTETLAAGINLPARSVVLPSLVKGPPTKRAIIEPSAAHQMFGRAGRPQFDDRGFVFVLAHEDDVKLLRWREKYDQIPEDTKDPGLMRAKKALKKKMPRRRETETYWTEEQFHKLRDAPPSRLASRGGIPWRLLAYLLCQDDAVGPLRQFVSKRLLPAARLEQSQADLYRMLMQLHRMRYVRLDPPPTEDDDSSDDESGESSSRHMEQDNVAASPALPQLTLGGSAASPPPPKPDEPRAPKEKRSKLPEVWPERAEPLEPLKRLVQIRSVHPLYGMFLLELLPEADRLERIQAFESLLELPMSVGPAIRVPWPDLLPPGALAVGRLDDQLLDLGLVSAEQLGMHVGEPEEQGEERKGRWLDEPPPRPLVFAEKLKLLFEHEYPRVGPLRTTPVWVAGELLELGGNFDQYITSHRLHKQEGLIFRHLLRMILLLEEFAALVPDDDAGEWQAELWELADDVTKICRGVDPSSTDDMLEAARRRAEEGFG